MNFEDKIRDAMGVDDDLEDNPNVYTEDYITRKFAKDLEPIGSGKSRHVYKIISDRFGPTNHGDVVKFAKSEEDKKTNRREMQTWMAVQGTEVDNYFCPIVDRDSDYRWIMMKFARPVDSDGMSHGFSFELENKLDVDIDAHRTNIGEHTTRGNVLIDYPLGGKVAFR